MMIPVKKLFSCCFVFVQFIIVLLTPTYSYAEQNKFWELGFGIGTLNTPNYRGSSINQTAFLPIPYFRYEGKFLRADDDSVTGQLLKTKSLEINISTNAAVSLNSTDDPIRSGMPQLDSTVEIGPSINLKLATSNQDQKRVLRLPMRSVFSLSREIKHLGWIFNPNITVTKHNAIGNWKLGYTIGLIYANKDYHDYYYQVSPEYSSPSRSVFEPRKGYSGFSGDITLTTRKNNNWYGIYIRYDNISGTHFANSPLVKTKDNFTVGFGISWILFGSDKSNL